MWERFLLYDQILYMSVLERAVGEEAADHEGDLSVAELLHCDGERVRLALEVYEDGRVHTNGNPRELENWMRDASPNVARKTERHLPDLQRSSSQYPRPFVLCHVGCGGLLPALARADAGLIQIIYDLTVPARNRRLALFPARGVPGVPSSAFPSYISSGSSASNVSSNLERRRGGRKHINTLFVFLCRFL